MTEKLKAYLDGLFEGVPMTREVQEAKDELYDGMLERYEDCLRQGMDEQAAYDSIVDSIGDIRELIDELDTGEDAAGAQGAAGPEGESRARQEGRSLGFDLGGFVKGITDFASGFVSGLFSEAPADGLQLANTVSLPLEGITNIDIAYISEQVTLRRGEGENLVINEYMNRDDPALLAEVSVTGDSIWVKHGWRNGMFFTRARIEVFLPQSWHGSLSMATVSGRLAIEDSWELTSLSAKTVSGGLQIDSVTAGMIRGTSTSGGVRIDHANGAMDLHSVSGSVLVEDAVGSGTFGTTSGSVRVQFRQLTGHVKASSVSGGVRVGLPEDAAVELEAHSTTGTIHTAFDGKMDYQGRSKAHGFVGQPPYFHVRLTSKTGGIHVND